MKRILSIIMLLSVAVLQGADTILYVNTDTGSGTTCSEGSPCASLSVAEAQVPADITTGSSQGIWTIQVAGTAADTTAVIVSGITTSETYYVVITAATGHRAKASGWDGGIYRLSVSNALALYLSIQYVRVDGLQIENYDLASALNTVSHNVAAGGSYHRISNCRIRSDANAGVTSTVLSLGDGDTSTMDVFNVIVSARADNAGTVDGVYVNSAGAGTTKLYNATVYGVRRAIRDASGLARVDVYDSVAFNNSGDDFYGTATAFHIVDYCASDDNVGTNNVAESGGGAAWPSDFEDAANGDFRLKSTSNLVGAANAVGSGLFSVDIDGSTRADWDVGADEYISAAVRRRVITVTQ